MTHVNRIVSRVILLAKLPGNKRRCEVGKELRAHLDDLAEEVRSQGYDDEATERVVSMRFGEPEEVAAAFASVYAPERLARRILQSAISGDCVHQWPWLLWSALCSRLRRFALRTQSYRPCGISIVKFFGFGAIAAGYCSLYAGERLFPTSLARTLLPSVTVGIWLGRGFRLADPTACGTAIGCLYVCRLRSIASARPNTFPLVGRNSTAPADSMGNIWATYFRLAVPVVGVDRLDNLLQGVARSCSTL